MKLAWVAASSVLAVIPTAAEGVQVATRSPVERVVALLEGLNAKINEDAEREENVYNRFACWCEKTAAVKASAISEAQNAMKMLGQEILMLKGKIATRSQEVQDLKQAIVENQQLQDEATVLRQQANGKFMQDADETKRALAALEGATQVLVSGSGATGASLLQVDEARAVDKVFEALPLHGSRISQQHVIALSELLSTREGYQPQSATVQGILKDMYDTFSADLEQATASEAKEQHDYEGLIADKRNEKEILEASHEKKAGQKADFESRAAESAQLYDSTREQLKADTVFFDETKATCLAKAEAWSIRKTRRDQELEGISKALEILTSDGARDLFAKSIRSEADTADAVDSNDAGAVAAPAALASFFQVAAGAFSAADAARSSAYRKLRAAARESNSLRVGRIAAAVSQVPTGHFDQVIQMIDKLVAVVKEEGQADIEKRDQCKSEYHKIQTTVAELRGNIERSTKKIVAVGDRIEQQQEDLRKTDLAIKATEQSMKDMTAERKEEHEAFLASTADDEQAVVLLGKARDALKKYYDENGIDVNAAHRNATVNFLQRDEPVLDGALPQAPEARFSSKDNHKGESADIIGLFALLIDTSNEEIRIGNANEKDAVRLYEEHMEAAKSLINELAAKRVVLEDAIAQMGAERIDEDVVRKGDQDELQAELKYEANIKPDCDWIILAFEERSKKRAAELDGLAAAKDRLASVSAVGANFVQEARHSGGLRGVRRARHV